MAQIHNMLVFELVNERLVQMLPSAAPALAAAASPTARGRWHPGESGELEAVVGRRELTDAELIGTLSTEICANESVLSSHLMSHPSHSHFALPGVSEEEYAVDAMARRCVLENIKDDKSDSSWHVQYRVQADQVKDAVAEAILEDAVADTAAELTRVLAARRTVAIVPK